MKQAEFLELKEGLESQEAILTPASIALCIILIEICSDSVTGM